MDDQKGYELDEEKQRAIDGVPEEVGAAPVPAEEPAPTHSGSVGATTDPDAPEPPPPNEPPSENGN